MRISINTRPFESDLFTTYLLMSCVEALFSLLMIVLWLLRIPLLFVVFLIGFPVDLMIYAAKELVAWIYRCLKNQKTSN